MYEFIVDPQEILGMPETAFILVDNSGQSRQVAMADANPGISLLDRVAVTPRERVPNALLGRVPFSPADRASPG